MTKPRRRLKSLTVNRVDFVDRPANPDARIAIYKRDDTPVTKAGRVLSDRNLSRVLRALTDLREVVEAAVGKDSVKTSTKYQVRSKSKQGGKMDTIAQLTEEFAKLSDLDGDELTSALESIGKSFEGISDEVSEAIETAKEEARKELSEQLAELAEADEDKNDADDITKRDDLPEDVRKRFEELEEANKAAEERVQKMEHDAQLATFIAKAKSEFSHVGKSEELGEALMSLADNEDAYKTITDALHSANAKIAEGSLYKSYGDTGDTATSEPVEKVKKAAEKLMAENEGMSLEQAELQVLSQNPALYTEYLAESRGK